MGRTLRVLLSLFPSLGQGFFPVKPLKELLKHLGSEVSRALLGWRHRTPAGQGSWGTPAAFQQQVYPPKSPFAGPGRELSHLLSSGFYLTRAVPWWSCTAPCGVLGGGNPAPTHHIWGALGNARIEVGDTGPFLFL